MLTTSLLILWGDTGASGGHLSYDFQNLKVSKHRISLVSGRKGLLRDQKKKERACLSLRLRTDAELSQFPKEAEAGEL